MTHSTSTSSMNNLNTACTGTHDEIIVHVTEGYQIDEQSLERLRSYARSNHCIALPIKTVYENGIQPQDMQRIPIEVLGPNYKILYHRSFRQTGHAWMNPYIFAMPRTVYEQLGPFENSLSPTGAAYDYTLRAAYNRIPVMVIDQCYGAGPLKICTELGKTDRTHIENKYFYRFSENKKRTRSSISWKELSASLPDGIEIISKLANFNNKVKGKSVAIIGSPDQWVEEVYDHDVIIATGNALDTIEADIGIVTNLQEMRRAALAGTKIMFSPGILTDSFTGGWLEPSNIYKQMTAVPTFSEYEKIFLADNAYWYDGAPMTLALSMSGASQCKSITIYSDAINDICMDSRVLAYRLQEIARFYKKQVRIMSYV